MANEKHPNEESLRPALWYLALMALIIATITAVMYWGFEIGSIYVVIGASIGGPIGMRSATALHLSPAGVRMNKVVVPWSALSLSRGRFGEWLQGAPHLPRRERIKVFIPMFETGWRTGRIGAHVEQHAPHLIGEVDAH